MRRNTARALVISSLLIALTGCTSTEPKADREIPLTTIPTLTNPQDIALPLDAYLTGKTAWHTPDRAINMLGRDCMQRFGLDWPIVESVPPDTKGPVYKRRYGLFEPEHAARNGYHPSREAEKQWQPVKRRDATPEEMAVWAGRGTTEVHNKPVPEGGCAGEAIRKLADGLAPPPQIAPEQLANQAFKRAEEHSRVRDAMNRWSDCMKARGFHFRVPSDASSDPRWHTPDPTQPEIETAKADVACKLEVNLVGIWYAAEVLYQKRIVEEKAAALAEVQRYNDTIVKNAAKVAAGQ